MSTAVLAQNREEQERYEIQRQVDPPNIIEISHNEGSFAQIGFSTDEEVAPSHSDTDEEPAEQLVLSVPEEVLDRSLHLGSSLPDNEISYSAIALVYRSEYLP